MTVLPIAVCEADIGKVTALKRAAIKSRLFCIAANKSTMRKGDVLKVNAPEIEPGQFQMVKRDVPDRVVCLPGRL